MAATTHFGAKEEAKVLRSSEKCQEAHYGSNI
jgi:hypothetical protein